MDFHLINFEAGETFEKVFHCYSELSEVEVDAIISAIEKLAPAITFKFYSNQINLN